jgi:FkbM family methyltransferase
MLVSIIKKVKNKISYLYRRYILRDSFLLAAERWFLDRGDQTLRLDYKLDSSSIVFDVGGYLGDYADDIFRKFGCRIFLFEPVSIFFKESVKRFKGNSAVTCFNYGLSSKSGFFDIVMNDNGSSFKNSNLKGDKKMAEVRSIIDAVEELGIVKIDLIKINIEGGEFDLLPLIISSGLVKKIRYIQVQFHNFDSTSVDSRLRIRKMLEKTHTQMWNYEFIWESWELH